MSEQNNEPVIRAAFEQCLIDGMKGEPLTNKEGDLVTTNDGEMVLGAPEASFLSVVRAYLKDLKDSLAKPKVPQTGKPASPLMQAAERRGLPFGGHVQ
jgi:hypothetical protein